MKRKIKFANIFSYFLVLCFLLNSGYCYILQNDNYTLISLFLCSIVTILYLGIRKRSFLKYKFWKHPFTWLMIWIMVSMLLHNEIFIWGTYIRQVLVLLIAVLISINFKFDKFIQIFIQFMFIVTIISIFAWFLVNIISLDLPLPTINSSWEKATYTEYKNGLLFFIYSHQPYRLMGPFWEPGLYSSMALIALLFNCSFYYNRHKKRIIDSILIIGIILSFSTAGYFLLLIVLIVKYLLKTKKRLSFGIFLLICFSLMLTVIYRNEIISFLAQIMPNIFGKMTFDSLSKSTRLNGPLVDIAIYLNHPFFGNGVKTYLSEWPIYANILNVESRTSTLTYFISIFGILGSIYGFSVFKGILSQSRIEWYIKIFILFFFISILTKEPHYLNLFVCTLLSYFIINKNVFDNIFNQNTYLRRVNL